MTALSFPLDLDRDPNQDDPLGDAFGVKLGLVGSVLGKGTLRVSVGSLSVASDAVVGGIDGWEVLSVKLSHWLMWCASDADCVVLCPDGTWDDCTSTGAEICNVSDPALSRFIDPSRMDMVSFRSPRTVGAESNRSRLRNIWSFV